MLAKKPHTGRTGLLVSLGIHACLIAAACSIPYVNLNGIWATSPTASVEPADLEPTSIRIPRVIESHASSHSPSRPVFSAAPLLAAMPLEVNHLDLKSPEITPFLTESVTQVPGPAVAPNTAPPDSSAPAVTPGRPAAKAGSGPPPTHNRTAKREAPIPPPRLLRAPPPRYPAAAKAAGKSGKVAVLVRVRGNGSAASTRLYHGSGNPALDQAAVDAARAWTFSPTPSLVGDNTVAVVVNITFAL